MRSGRREIINTMKKPPYLYALSLPERMLRTISAVGGGFLRELSLLALPNKIRDAAIYRATAGVGLRFFIEQLGGVQGIYPPHDPIARKFVYRYAAGTTIELFSLASFFVSPVWIRAALGDVTRAGKEFYVQIGEALKSEGLIGPNEDMESFPQMLDGLSRTSSHLAMTVNMPPLDAESLRREWMQFREHLSQFPKAGMPSAAEVEQAWTNLQATADELKTPVSKLSWAMGMAAFGEHLRWWTRSAGVAARAAGTVAGTPFIEHYESASKEILKEGLEKYVAKHTAPYLAAAVRHFHPRNPSWTERIFVRPV